MRKLVDGNAHPKRFDGKAGMRKGKTRKACLHSICCLGFLGGLIGRFMIRGDRRWLAPFLGAASLPMVFVACKREDPQIRALTEKAAQSDEASRQLRQAWSEQFHRLTLARVQNLHFGTALLLLTGEQKKALEARVRIEKDSSRRGLLREILDKDTELQALSDRLQSLKAALPPPEIAKPNDSHYGLALRFLRSQGQTDAQARKAISRVILSERLAPGFEVYHFYVNGQYGTWVAQGAAAISPVDLVNEPPDDLASERNRVVAMGRRLQRELALLEAQKQGIEQEIATIQAERARFLDGRNQLQSEHDQQVARLNALHYLVGVREALVEKEIIRVPLFGLPASGRNWGDAVFTHDLDLREGHTILFHAQDLGLRQISKVTVVPGSYALDEHYRLTLSLDRQTAIVELLAPPRFKNDKVVFAVED